MAEKHFCPNCGSRDISADTDGFVKRWRNADVWICESCGYNGFMPEGDPDKFDFERDENTIEKTYDVEPLGQREISLLIISLSIILAISSIII